MKVKVKLKANMFYVYIDNTFSEAIPAFIIQYEAEVIAFGKEAYRSVEIYPNYVYSYNKALFESDFAALEKILLELHKYIYSKYHIGISLFEINELTPDVFMSYFLNVNKKLQIIEKITTYKEEPQNKPSQPILLKNKKGNKKGLHLELIATEVYRIVSNSIKINSNSNYEQYREKTTELFNITKNLYDGYSESFKENNNKPLKIKTSDYKGNINTYDLIFDYRVNSKEHKGFKFENKYESYLYDSLELLKNSKTKVLLLSPFSYGKSTIINGLEGFDALKMEYTAETSSITEVTFSPVPMLIIEYNDKTIEFIKYSNMDELRKLLPNYNGITAKRTDVTKISLYCPEADLNYITLIDSPGLLSKELNHDDITDNELKDVDFVVFVIDHMQVGARSYMTKVKEYVDKFKDVNYCFLINRLDMFYKTQEKIEKELILSLKHYKIPEAPIYKISGLFGYVGKCWEKGLMDIDTVQCMGEIYSFNDEGKLVAGELLKPKYIKNLINFSNLRQFEQYLFSNFEAKRI